MPARYTPPREGLSAAARRPRRRRSHRRDCEVARQGWCATDERRLARTRGSRLPLMTTALVVGVGAVGTRAARQLIDTPGIDRLLLADRDDTQLTEVADALGPDAGAIDFAPGDPIPSH